MISSASECQPSLSEVNVAVQELETSRVGRAVLLL